MMPTQEHSNRLESQFFHQLKMNYKGDELDAAEKVSEQVLKWATSSRILQENITIDWTRNKFIVLKAEYKTSCMQYGRIIISISSERDEVEIPFKKLSNKSPYIINDESERKNIIHKLKRLGIEGKGKELQAENRFKIPFMSIAKHIDAFCGILNLIIEKIDQEEERNGLCQRQIPFREMCSEETTDLENTGLFREVEEVSSITKRIENEDWKEIENFEDSRKRTERSIVQRRGQPQFREKLLKEYGGKCVITGCDAEQALEAAHIYPYMGEETNQVENGLLLRSDIHTLFDRYLITIDPKTYKVCIAPELMETTYRGLNEESLNIRESARLDRKYLEYHYNISLQQWKTNKRRG